MNIPNVSNFSSPVFTTIKSGFLNFVSKKIPSKINETDFNEFTNSNTNVPIILSSQIKLKSLTPPEYSKSELEIISKFKNVENISSYANMDLLMEIYFNKNLWVQLYNRVNVECANDPAYLACVNSYSYSYPKLVTNEATIWFKFTHSYNSSNGFEYKPGFNADTQSFKPFGSCNGGGLYFCKLEDLYQFKEYGKYLTPIIVPAGIPIYEEPVGSNGIKKFKAPGLFILPRINIINPEACQLVAQASKFNNSAFGFLRWYNSNNPEQLKMFLRDSNNGIGWNWTSNYNYLWSKERALCGIKLDLLDSSKPVDMNLIHKFPLVLKSNRNKEFFNQLINSVFPKLFSTNNFYMIGIHPITVLNLDTFAFVNHIGQEYYNLIKRFSGVIAGSSVLEYVTGIKFKPNDIDVYIGPEQLGPFEVMLGLDVENKDVNDVKSRGQFQFTLKTKPKELEFFTWSPNEVKVKVQVRNEKVSSINKQYNMNGIVKVYNLLIYNWAGTKIGEIQFICVNSDPAQFIKKNFDFDMCAIGFDTKQQDFVNLIGKSNYRKLRITKSYINKMTGMETDSWSNYRAVKTIGRIAKYAIRGFYVENWKDFLIEIRDKLCL